MSVVVPARNAARSIASQLEALTQQDFAGRWEIVVADNGSTDQTSHVVEAFCGRPVPVTIVDGGTRPGTNIARNRGIRATSAPLIVIADADDLVDRAWLRAMVDGLATNPVIGGRLEVVAHGDPRVLELRPWRFTGLAPFRRFLPYAVGCNMGFRREVFDHLDGFDEEFITGGTEVEFCWRAQIAGFPLGYVGEAVVYYSFRDSIPATLRQMHQQSRSQPKLYRKFRPHGMPAPNWRRTGRYLAWTIVAIPLLPFSRARRYAWLRYVADTSGRMRGSLENRVLYL